MKQKRRTPARADGGNAARTIDDEVKAARSKGVRLLAASAKSARQLVERLERAGFAADVARRAVESLVTLRLIDDDALGRAVVRRVRRAAPAARGLVRAKLIASGLDEGLAEQVLEEEMEGTDDDSEALALVRLLAAGKGSEPGPRVRGKVLGALARRGFDAETAERAVRTVMGKGGQGEAAWE